MSRTVAAGALALAAALAAGCAGQRGALQAQRSPFTHLDADGDGYLVHGELAGEPALAATLARWDGDGDGRISYPEYTRYRGHALD